MTQGRQKSETIGIWLDQQGAADAPLHHIARALGTGRQETEALLQVPPTAEALLNLNRLAQVRHFALAHRVWPNCTWLDWRNEPQSSPVIKLVLDTFGRSLLEYVQQTYGKKVVLEYLADFEVPPRYTDLALNEDADDPLANVPDDQFVFNPHLTGEDDGQFFVFGSPETAACFRWLISSRYNYTHYVDNRAGYLNDPLGIELAFDLRNVIQEEYWSPLPPNTLSAYLAIARVLHEAVVPEEYQEGRLPLLEVVHIADLPDDRLTIVQANYERLWVDYDEDVLVFDQAPVRAFVLDFECQSPAALILTTHDEPGNPEQHRQGEPYRYLEESFKMLALALTPNTQIDLEAIDQIGQEVLDGENYGFHVASNTFYIIRANPNLGESPDGPIPIYRIPGGYMFQFNPEYDFNPQEMAVD
ncbi:hypothetical protein ACFLYO_05950 [Chloroflexota bacterium]